MNKKELDLVYEALLGAYEELEAFESTYAEYVTSGKLMEQIEEAIKLVEENRR